MRKVVFNPLTARFDLIDVASASSSVVPVFVPSGSTFTVPRYAQMLYETPIDCEGVIDLDGILVEVT